MGQDLTGTGITNTINGLADQGWGSPSKLWPHVRGTREGEILGIMQAADASGIPEAHKVGDYYFSDAPGSRGWVPGDGKYHRYIFPTGFNNIILGPASGRSGTMQQGGINYGEGGRHTRVDVLVSPPGMVVEVKACCMSGRPGYFSATLPASAAQNVIAMALDTEYLKA